MRTPENAEHHPEYLDSLFSKIGYISHYADRDTTDLRWRCYVCGLKFASAPSRRGSIRICSERCSQKLPALGKFPVRAIYE